MAIVTKQYVRNPLFVDVVEVTAENFGEVATWCNGDLANRNGAPLERDANGVPIIHNPLEMYINVRVHSPKSLRQTQAYVGDFILYTDRGYKVYTPGAFHASWSPVTPA